MILLHTIRNSWGEVLYQSWDRTDTMMFCLNYNSSDRRTPTFEYTSNLPVNSKIAFIANEQQMSDYHRQLQARIFVPKGRR
jgi:hypothetical protein